MAEEEQDIFEIIESIETFDSWSQVNFIDDDLREAIKNSAILLVPTIGFRSSEEPVFPTDTEDIFQFFQENFPADLSVEILANDDALHMLALHSDYKRLGKFFVKQVALQVFIGVLTAYINSKVIAPQDCKPQIIINNIIQQAPAGVPQTEKHFAKHRPYKYHDPSKVTFTVTVQDTSGKCTTFHYEGSVSGVKPVTDKIKQTFLDESQKTGN